MQPPNKIRLGLAAKLAICVIASTAAFFALFGYINLRMERTHSEELIKQSAYRIADVILRSTHYEMLHNDRDALYNIIRELGSENGIRRIRLRIGRRIWPRIIHGSFPYRKTGLATRRWAVQCGNDQRRS